MGVALHVLLDEIARTKMDVGPRETCGLDATTLDPAGAKIAPMQFDFRDGRLVLLRQASEVDKEDVTNVEAARAGLLETGDRLIEEVKRSNCDRRLLDSISFLQEKISSYPPNVIQIGLSNMACDMSNGRSRRLRRRNSRMAGWRGD